MSSDHGPRLRELAEMGARALHNLNGTNGGHDLDGKNVAAFGVCPHPDCALVRASAPGLPEKEEELKRANARIVELEAALLRITGVDEPPPRKKATHCVGCGQKLDTFPYSSTFYRQDDYCTARCKRKTGGKRYEDR